MILCNYGCGKEAKYQLKNGKWCCCKFYQSCPAIKIKNKNWHKKRKISKNTKNKTSLSLKKYYKIHPERSKKHSKCLKWLWEKGVYDKRDISGKRNGMYGVHRYGKNNPMYGKMNKVKNYSKGEKELIDKIKAIFLNADFKKETINYNNINMVPDSVSNKKRVIVEYDGEQHFVDVDYLSETYNFEKQKERDKNLEDFVFENGYRLIRVDEQLYNQDKEKITEAVIGEIRSGVVPIVKFGERYYIDKQFSELLKNNAKS